MNKTIVFTVLIVLSCMVVTAFADVHIDAQALLDAWSQREGHWSTWRYKTWAAYREETGDSAPMYTLPSADEMTEAEAIRRVDEIILAEYPHTDLAGAVLGTVFIRPQGDPTPYWDISYRETTVDESGAHPYLFNVHLSVTDGSHELAVRMSGWDEIVPDIKFTPILHYNSLGGKYFHADPECATVSPEYLPLEAFNKQMLTETPYRKLKPCFECVLTREP